MRQQHSITEGYVLPSSHSTVLNSMNKEWCMDKRNVPDSEWMKGLTKIGTLLSNSCFASFLACNAELVSSFLRGIMGMSNCSHLEVPMPFWLMLLLLILLFQWWVVLTVWNGYAECWHGNPLSTLFWCVIWWNEYYLIAWMYAEEKALWMCSLVYSYPMSILTSSLKRVWVIISVCHLHWL